MPALRTAEVLDFARIAEDGGPLAFVSDIHLRFGDADYLAQFTSFLDWAGARVRGLVIHGDLFDFYVGGRQGRQEFYEPLFSGLRRLRERGLVVAALFGNRDYLLDRRFEEHGVLVVPDRIRFRVGSDSVQVSHGDEFCIHDRSYQFWARGVLRSAPVRWLVRALPLPIAFAAARRYRGVSTRKGRRPGQQSSRLGSILDGVREFVGKEPTDIVICGHIHDLRETDLRPDGPRLLTTGAWEDSPNCILLEEGGFRIQEIDPAVLSARSV